MARKLVGDVGVTLERGGHIGCCGAEVLTYTLTASNYEADVEFLARTIISILKGQTDDWQIILNYHGHIMIYSFRLLGQLACELENCLRQWLTTSQVLLHNTGLQVLYLPRATPGGSRGYI